MNRDMDLVRQILLAVESHPHGFAPRTVTIEGYTQEQIGYHATIMSEAGLVVAINATSMGSISPEALISRLTWQGHEFLDSSRDPGIWEQAHSLIGTAGGASFQLWLAVLTDLVKRNIGLS